jgi:hypothetical protein
MAVGKMRRERAIFGLSSPRMLEHAQRFLAFSSYTRNLELEGWRQGLASNLVRGGADIGLARKYILFV